MNVCKRFSCSAFGQRNCWVVLEFLYQQKLTKYVDY